MGFLGRVGEGVKVRGMFVHSRQLEQALSSVEGAARFQAVVRQENHQDEITVRVESRPDATLDEGALAEALRSALKVRVSVEILAPGSLPKDAQALLDTRTWD